MRTVPLQQICDIQIGKTPSRSVPEYWGGELPWVTISDFAAGRIVTTTQERITRIGAAKSGSKQIPRGTLLLSFKLSLGKRAFAGCDLFTNEAIAALHVLDHDVADRGYLYWALGSLDYDRLVDRAAKGKTLNKAKLKILRIPLPPLAEQKRIAGILDAADALRAKRCEALAQLDSLLQSTFLDMFGDPVTNSNIPSAIMTELVTKFIDYRGKSPEKSKGGVPLITAKIVKEKEVKEPNEFIPANSYDAWMRRGIPNPGDVVITTEAPMGEVALVPDYKAAFAQRLLVLQPDETKVKSIYLMWALTMPFVIRQLRQRSTGSTVTGIRSREFKKVTLPIPSLDLQRRFAAIVESVEQQKASQRTHMAELDTLFASLQARAFRGHL